MTSEDEIRARSLEQVRYLTALMGTQSDLEQRIDAYLSARRTLAEYFRTTSANELDVALPSIQRIKVDIGNLLEVQLDGYVPPELLHVRGYGGTHQALLTYLARHVGDFVPADRLRVLTGDQVHTERRVRELRDLGLVIEAQKTAGRNQYLLQSTSPDLTAGAIVQLRLNLRPPDWSEDTLGRFTEILRTAGA